MFCAHCGAANADDGRICTSCGQVLIAASPYQAVAATNDLPHGRVSNYLLQSILVTVCCCPPFGIVAIVYAAQVDGKLAVRDYSGIVQASKSAKMWCWISFGICLGGVALYFLLIAIFVAAGTWVEFTKLGIPNMPAGWLRFRWLLLLPLVLCAAAAIVLLYRVDPSHSDRYPKCTFHLLTGLHCPGCGATRAVHALLHGRLLLALQFNALLVVGVPLVLLFTYWRKRWGIGQFKTAVAAWAIAIVVIVFSVVRNIPSYPFELLAPPKAPSWSAAELNLDRQSPSTSTDARVESDRVGRPARSELRR